MALLITPILVSVGWIFNKPLTLDFNMLEISVLGAAILIVNYLVAVRSKTFSPYKRYKYRFFNVFLLN